MCLRRVGLSSLSLGRELSSQLDLLLECAQVLALPLHAIQIPQHSLVQPLPQAVILNQQHMEKHTKCTFYISFTYSI